MLVTLVKLLVLTGWEQSGIKIRVPHAYSVLSIMNFKMKTSFMPAKPTKRHMFVRCNFTLYLTQGAP